MYQENISQLLMNISPGGFVPTTEAPVPLTSLHIALPWAHVKRPGNVAKMIQHPWIFPSNASSMWNVVRQEYFSKARDSHCDCEHWFTFSIVFPSLSVSSSFSILFDPFRAQKDFAFHFNFSDPKEVAACPSAAISYGAADPSSRRHQCGRCGGCGAAHPGGAGSGGATEGDLQRVAGCFRRCKADGGLGHAMGKGSADGSRC